MSSSLERETNVLGKRVYACMNVSMHACLSIRHICQSVVPLRGHVSRGSSNPIIVHELRVMAIQVLKLKLTKLERQRRAE